jgi:hypothetical protein
MDKEYLYKVINQIARETRIDYKRKLIHAPFSHHGTSFPFGYLRSYFFPYFFKYCRNIYGLTEEETEYVWYEYEKIIKNKIKNKPLNESTEDNALNKIVDQLVGESKIDYEENVVYPPYPSHLAPYNLYPPYYYDTPDLFTIHCRNIYGLTEPEIEYVWEEYKQIITDKIHKSLNESTNYYSDFDEDSFIIRTVNQMVKETKIWALPGYWYKMSILLPFNTQSISIHIFDFKYWGYTFEGLDSDKHERVNNYFNAFGVTEEEKDTVWDIYAAEVNDMIKQKIESND